MLRFFKYLLKVTAFWLVFFLFHRLIFIIFNYGYSNDASFNSLFASFIVGFRLDLSFTGYILLLTCLLQLLSLLVLRRFEFSHLNWLHYIIIPVFMALMLGDTGLYSYWGRHIDGEALSFLSTPGIIFDSLSWFETLLFVVVFIVLSFVAIYIYKRLIKINSLSKKLKLLPLALSTFIVLFLGGLMIIPIRGGFGIAPINVGHAYFSPYMYANHSAVNPLWNLFYSYKRFDSTTRHYHFMDEDEAEEIFKQMTKTSGDTKILLNNARPDIVIILLESFSAQIIKSLGGEAVTPNFEALVEQGALFSNIYAASDRSDKGLVATIAGHQVMPGYSIIQYPSKLQSLNFLPKILKDAGYNNLSFIYGGDIGFKSMNSLVTLAGFEKIITMDDFPSSTQGKKWGVHDEYTFNRLLEEMTNDSSPFFHFYFTLSSHEPFDVPMEKVYDDPYLNSIFYTDKCLGDFFDEVKKRGLWDNTLFVLIADHGVPGPHKATSQMKERYHIPMLWTGGALAVKDTVITTLGSQTDLVSTLLYQLELVKDDFVFSKNLMADEINEFAFFTYPNAFGFINKDFFIVYDDNAGRYIVSEGEVPLSTYKMGEAYLQVLSGDHLKR